jgi:hypothetical protein
MTRTRQLITITITLGVAALGWWWYQLNRTDADKVLTHASTHEDATRSKGTEAKIGNAKSIVTTRPALPSQTETYRQFVESRDFFPLYNALGLRTDAEAKFYRATILERCKGYGQTYRGESIDLRLKRQLASITGPFVEQRQEIYRDWSPRSAQALCAGFPNAISDEDIDKAYGEAAAAGDPRAKLSALRDQIMSSAPTQTKPVHGLPFDGTGSYQFIEPRAPTEAQANALKEALASKDPTQILYAGPLLTGQYAEYELKFGDGDGRVGIYHGFLWQSVACHYAGGCGQDSFEVRLNCAMHARCDALSYDDMVQRYHLTADDWLRFQEYRRILIRAIDEQNWALLMESRGPATNRFRHAFSPHQTAPRFSLRF